VYQRLCKPGELNVCLSICGLLITVFSQACKNEIMLHQWAEPM